MTERLHVAFLTPTFHPEVGGAETYTRWVLAGLASRGHRVWALAGAAPGLPRSGEVGGVTVLREGPRRGEGVAGRARWLPSFARAAARRLDLAPPDVLLAQYSALLAAARYAHSRRLPLVALVHDVYGLRESLRHRGVLAGLARYAASDRALSRLRPRAVVAVSEATAAGVRRLTTAPVVVARPGADHVPEGPDPDPGSLQVLFVGRPVASKGLRDALRAVELARGAIPGLRLLVAGGGRGAADGGPLGEEELDRAFRSSALLLFPSRREGWGLAVTEAAARGLPYVAYDVPAVREQHRILGGGLLVPPGDVPGLAAAVRRLLADPGLRRSLGSAGRRRARDSLRWEAAVAAVERCLRAAADGGAA